MFFFLYKVFKVICAFYTYISSQVMLVMFKSSLITLALGHHTEQLKRGVKRVDSEAAEDERTCSGQWRPGQGVGSPSSVGPHN